MDDQPDYENIRHQLNELRIEHRDLDEIIDRLSESTLMDQVRLRRLKKKRLLLKDMIVQLESRLIPDMDA